jgi:hypothetical protein
VPGSAAESFTQCPQFLFSLPPIDLSVLETMNPAPITNALFVQSRGDLASGSIMPILDCGGRALIGQNADGAKSHCFGQSIKGD